ncbi:hypothetical protein GPECTOR_4g555 [Gonium pectorale]|uniref:ABC transporter domain-containing protein n=1 Tax=Gonium pectorale TaxID=33097 RepID=A0A150GYT4_GONPE|nr:hypothetical protein GPECTOR_4g555 [Gonium pectorale]|eukprot:KXZ54490.1 hypothetical protein GPECTOR_4g555 [Gonium pectorale]
MAPLLEVRGLRRDVAERSILANISFTLDHGQILFVRGPSGVGKSLLLRAIACLDHLQGGSLLLHGLPPCSVGYPAWRTCVAYVPQSRASSLRGTPAELYFQAQRFAAQRGRPRGDLPALVGALGLEQSVLNQQWGELSGGQAQRVGVAIAVALGPAVLLLDEPTSACDAAAALRMERMLAGCGSALIWVTHDPQQPSRLGGRVLELPLGNVLELPPPPPLPPALQMQPPLRQALAGADGDDGGAADGGPGSAAPGVALTATLPRPASRAAELLRGNGDGDGDAGDGYGETFSDSPLSPPSPSQLRNVR